MITQTTTTRRGRPSWRTPDQPTTVTEHWTQIEGLVTDILEHRPYEGSHQVTLVHTIDAGDQTATVQIIGQLAQTTDGTDRDLPHVGEQVRILAKPTREGTPAASLAAYSAHHVTILDA